MMAAWKRLMARFDALAPRERVLVSLAVSSAAEASRSFWVPCAVWSIRNMLKPA